MKAAGPDEIQREMERFFAHLGRWKRPVFFFEKAWKPLCDVYETDDEVIVLADVAGVNSEDIKVVVDEESLVISGVRHEPVTAERLNYYQMEISFGPFERDITLPSPVDPEKAQASFDDGFLEIRLPKVRPETVGPVEIEQGDG